MTSKASIVKNLPLITVILLAVFFRLYKLPVTYSFNYDQQVAAEAAYQFYKFHKLSLIGQELSFQGLFLGPLHNVIEFIPYGACGLMPDCVPYFHLLISLGTIVFLYLLIKSFATKKIAIIASAIYSISFAFVSFTRSVDSNYFIFLSTIFLLFSLKKFFEGSNKYFYIGSFVAGVATVNFNPIFFFNFIAYFATAFLKKGKTFIIFPLGIIFFSINYLPLIIFNLKHQNLLLLAIYKFISQGYTQQNYLEKFPFLLKNVAIPYFSTVIFFSANIFIELFIIALLLAGAYFIIKDKRKYLIFLLLSPVFTFIGLFFYSRHIPDYYFKPALLSVLSLVAISVSKRFSLFVAFTTLFLFLNTNMAYSLVSSDSYSNKKAAIKYIIDDSKGSSFNIYYDMPLGINTGYNYILKVYGVQPIENGKNLYILVFRNPTNFDTIKYYRSFKDKKIEVNHFGFINVFSIK